jgi:hypothetical protein
MWFELRYAALSGASLNFDMLPYRGPGPKQGGYCLSFDTPPYRGPGPKQGGYGLSFDTPPYRNAGPNQGGYGLSFDTPRFGGRGPRTPASQQLYALTWGQGARTPRAGWEVKKNKHIYVEPGGSRGTFYISLLCLP